MRCRDRILTWSIKEYIRTHCRYFFQSKVPSSILPSSQLPSRGSHLLCLQTLLLLPCMWILRAHAPLLPGPLFSNSPIVTHECLPYVTFVLADFHVQDCSVAARAWKCPYPQLLPAILSRYPEFEHPSCQVWILRYPLSEQ